MNSVRTKIKTRLSSHADKQRQYVQQRQSLILFAAFVVTLVVGYAAGTYHYQIEAYVGPVFGYKAHSATIDLSSLEETYNKLAANYDGNLNMTSLIDGANRGLVDAVGDEYTLYMTTSEASEFNKSLSGEIGAGIGAEIGIRKDQITILRVLDDNPAIKAGLLANDMILKINDESTAGWTVDEAVSKIRGAEGTTVKLAIKRGDATSDYSITRAIINNPSVTSTESDGLGIITISRFDDETGDLARVAAQKFIRDDIKSVILDLRGNGGGYVDAARDVASLWLDNKVIATERTGNVINSTIRSSGDAILSGIPTVVLIDSSSASASEIVAGALQDHSKAKVAGETSFGKGSVQKLVGLSGGAELKVTVARWYTPHNKNITGSGIKPDEIVKITQDDIYNGIDPQLNKAKELLGH